MPQSRSVPIIAALALLCTPLGCTRPPDTLANRSGASETLVLQNVTIIDGISDAPMPGRSVVIADGRIAAIYRAGSRAEPTGARVVDLSGRYLIPGLIDAHVHLKTQRRDPGVMERILANVFRGGVTTVRDMGGNGAELAPLAAASRSDDAATPRILLSTLVTGEESDFWMSGEPGGYVTGGGVRGGQPWFRRLADAADLDQAVAEARGFGAAGIKLHSGLDAALMAAVARSARRRGLLVWAHAFVGPALPSDAVAAGATSISHADMLAYEGLGAVPAGFGSLPYIERTTRAMRATPVDGAVLGRLFERMRARSICLEPTLLVMEPVEPTPERTLYVGYAAAATARAHRLGVPICAGTDRIGGSTANLPAELELLVARAGLTPMAAIRSATSVNARALGLTDRGIVRRGMIADLVVLSADPSLDIANIRAVEAVIRAGRLHDPTP